MEFTAVELWSRVLEGVRQGIPEQSYRTWFSGTRAIGLSENTLLVEAPSQFHVEWLEDKYGAAVREGLERATGRPLQIELRSTTEGASLPPPLQEPEATEVAFLEAPQPASEGRSPSAPSAPEPQRLASLNDRYTFDRFVVGQNNQLAVAASRAVAERPGRIYNPLFMYGGVGLGKTHLMHAIGQSVLTHSPGARVAYVTSERFMNELVNAIQQGKTPAFRTKYRQIDLLLVDDVHFLEGKESTQEEFFHTFNALYDAGRQIVLTSDRPPKELPGLEDRLVSRFEWGLVADIKPPDYETRVAILQKKAADDGLVIDDEVNDFIARSCTSSVRELEGAVIKLLAYSSLRNEEISVELARIALQSVLRGHGPGGRPLTPDRIRDQVALAFDLRPELLSSKKRSKEVMVPRQIAMYLIRTLLDTPLVQIGRSFGGRDHSTVIHSIRRVEEEMESDPRFAAQVTALRQRLSQGS